MKKYYTFSEYLESLTISELIQNTSFDYDIINGLDNEVRESELDIILPVGGYNPKSRSNYLRELESANEDMNDLLKSFAIEIIENTANLKTDLEDSYNQYLACLGYSLQEVA